MSPKTIEFVSVEARLSNYGIVIEAAALDDEVATVKIEGSDIRAEYGCNPAAFLEAYGDNENVLFDLFHSVYGISYAD